MILICANEIAGPTGYHKSVVETANALHRAGYSVTVLSFVGKADGANDVLPRWPLDVGVPALVLRTLPADGGRLLHENVHPALTGRFGTLPYELTANQLAALRQIDAALTPDDTVVFTSPLQAFAYRQALGGAAHRPRTVLQIHGDYLHHTELWDLMMQARPVIDRVQTVASGLRQQFVPTYDDADVVFIPNIHDPSPIERVEHAGVNIALPASFQHRKNQLDAVRALALVEDPSVHLTLWGNVNPLNPYYNAVRQAVDSLGLGDRVHLPGFGTEADVYGGADIVVMTSLSEGFGYPLLEAAYHHLPVVTYDYDFGPRDAVVDGESGYVVPVGDVGALAERLRTLAADPALRARLGGRARDLFDERFTPQAIARQYGALVGEAPGRAGNLAALFVTEGGEPVRVDEISHRVRRDGVRKVHEVTVSSPVALHDVLVDDGERVASPAVVTQPGVTRIEFPVSGARVVSYTTAPGSPDRHYLASTTRTGAFEVLPYLRRDAAYGDGTPPVEPTLFASSGGAGHLAVREVSRAVVDLAAKARAEVALRAGQLRPAARTAAPASAAPVSAPAPAPAGETPAPAATPLEPATPPARPSLTGRLTQAAGLPANALGSVGRVAAGYGKAAVTSVVHGVAIKTPVPARLEIARHPQFPVSAGVDSFGAAVNSPGGVTVRNTGSPRRPTVSVDGEYDWLLLRDGASTRRIAPPFTYGELFDGICAAERDFGLFDITTRDGDHLWEHGRSALVIQLAEAAGLWGKSDALPAPVQDVYSGPKRLTGAPSARRVVFDYARRGGTDYRTAAFRGDDTLFVVQPEADGYPEVDDDPMVFPIHEYNRWRAGLRRRWTHLRVPEVDARPFEEALTAALGIKVGLGDHLRNRLAKFLLEREFWTPVFERIQPEEVLVASSHWWSGVSAAATRAGATVSDIQYAETGRYHATYWFGGRPHHGASRLYAWSDFWAERTNVYQEHVVVPRRQPDLQAALAAPADLPQTWDVCVVSQTRTFRRILAFVTELVTARPGLRVVIAPHPVQRPVIAAQLAAAGLTGKVDVASDDTLTTVQQAAVCVGGYSTSLWEAAALGRPTYVIPVPGHELTLPEVESGIFRLARSPHDLVPYEVPAARRRIFADA